MPSGVEHGHFHVHADKWDPPISAPMPSGVEHRISAPASGDIVFGADLRSDALGR